MSDPEIKFTTPKTEHLFGGWSRNCVVNDIEYNVMMRRGKSVRIPYHKKRGWQWHGTVYSNGRCVFSGRVPGSLGVRGLLIEAGVL